MWDELKKRKGALVCASIIALFFLVGLYAPFFASSKPIALIYDGKLYFPLFRALFYPGFFTKPIDLFYNVLMFVFPLAIVGCLLFKKRKIAFLSACGALQIALFALVMMGTWKNPERDLHLEEEKKNALKNGVQADWAFELKYMNDYSKLNLLLKYKLRKEQQMRLAPYLKAYEESGKQAPTLFARDELRFLEEKKDLRKTIEIAKTSCEKAASELPLLIQNVRPLEHALILAKAELKEAENDVERHGKAKEKLALLSASVKEKQSEIEEAKRQINQYKTISTKEKMIEERKNWEKSESLRVKILFKPLVRPFHWEDEAGGGQGLNQVLPWWELTRINRKDLTAALIFGIRISLVVGMTAVALALAIGIPLGVTSGYFAGKSDIAICRLIEIWEAMPAFFMLLLIVAIAQSKSLFLVIFILAVFGWTHFTRYIRAEVLKQRNLPYVLACRALGFNHGKIMFSHILPNAIPPVLTLLPFSIMAAITSEAGLSFLGLGEEGSTSWGVLMAEGRSVFPGESYLLWPPAILLTLLLVSIALVGDALRDSLDPKMRS